MFSLTSFYLIGICVLSIALGIQIIVLPWLVVDELQLTSVWVGWIQAALLVPNLLLLLIGGITADRGKGMRWLVPLLLTNIVIYSCLAIIIKNSWLTISLLILYAMLLGITNAFIQPWREYLLKKINDQGLQKLVAKSSLCLYGGQAVGVAIASLMDILGVFHLLIIQIIMVGIAAASFSLLIKALPHSAPQQQHPRTSHQLLIGLKDIWQQPALRSLIMIVAFNGFFHIGVFIVSLPLLVQQVYGETVSFYSSLQFTFVAGTIVTTLTVIYRGFLDAPGRRIIFGLLYGGVILLALSARPTLTGLFILLFFWGVVVGVSSNMGRTVLQALAPESSRGRMISIYQLALFGFAPLGALFAGYAIEVWGVLMLFKISGIASLIAFSLTLVTRSLWEIEAESQSSP